ncbi:hypothetical protein BS630_06080 [Rhizobium laguerreae]|uniref:acyltransferase family protein n=1 Tax=Rhizobium laguerreae TaxID=1076926 RepID=UPI00098F226E|nr:acyltransferase family protein [Rhizobium laguerreae]OOO51949.1 hypothetical protein BS630_06080 [Rhizobium laguerreae]
MTSPAHRPDIDGLRAIAVLAVVLYHAGVHSVGGGFVGVDVFFVVSGFLITTSILRRLERAGFSTLDFFDRRARRLAGAYLIVIACTWLLSFVLMMPEDYRAFVESIQASAYFAANHHFYERLGYFDTAHITKPLLHLWSLAVEEQFYIGIAALFSIATFRTRTKKLSMLVIFGASLIASAVVVHMSREMAFFWLPFRAWELACGVAIGFYLHGRPAPSSMALSGGGLVALVVLLLCIIFYRESFLFPGLSALPPVLAAGVIIIAGSNHASRISQVLNWSPLTAIGRRSYGIYLIHWPLIVLLTYYLDRLLHPPEVLAVMLVTLALSELSWRLVEEPIRTRPSAFFRHETLAATVVALVGIISLTTLPFSRVPLVSAVRPEAAELARGRSDWSSNQIECVDRTISQIQSGDFCRLGKIDGRKALLWGDSHASAILPVAESLANKFALELHVLTHNGCPPMLKLETDKVFCRSTNDTIAELLEKERYEVVIMAANWQSYGTSNIVSIGGQALNARMDEMREALRQTLAAIRSSGATPLLVGQVPTYDVDVPAFLGRAAYYEPVDAVLGYHRQLPAPHLDPPYVNEVVASEKPRVIRPSESLCSSARCEVSQDGRSMYKDGGHLSRFGSNVLREPMSEALRDILR